MKGKGTKILIAALKFWFNYCEKREFDFSKLIKTSKNGKPHQVINGETLNLVFQKSKDQLELHAAIHLLYELAARI